LSPVQRFLTDPRRKIVLVLCVFFVLRELVGERDGDGERVGAGEGGGEGERERGFGFGA